MRVVPKASLDASNASALGHNVASAEVRIALKADLCRTTRTIELSATVRGTAFSSDLGCAGQRRREFFGAANQP